MLVALLLIFDGGMDDMLVPLKPPSLVVLINLDVDEVASLKEEDDVGGDDDVVDAVVDAEVEQGFLLLRHAPGVFLGESLPGDPLKKPGQRARLQHLVEPKAAVVAEELGEHAVRVHPEHVFDGRSLLVLWEAPVDEGW